MSNQIIIIAWNEFTYPSNSQSLQMKGRFYYTALNQEYCNKSFGQHHNIKYNLLTEHSQRYHLPLDLQHHGQMMEHILIPGAEDMIQDMTILYAYF